MYISLLRSRVRQVKEQRQQAQGKRSFLLCAKGESGVATVEAARKHAH